MTLLIIDTIYRSEEKDKLVLEFLLNASFSIITTRTRSQYIGRIKHNMHENPKPRRMRASD